MRMNLDGRGREVMPTSFSSKGRTVFVVVGGLSRRFGWFVYPCPVCGVLEAGVEQRKGGIE